ncbi:unnamed protein product [Bursaphelenchus xylophilus]|uniref:COMM domain-containing protein 3 n=1 Tax=Bursaphelenchus xylophilus TaxID=6326 RepID=A0A1I7SQR6_BURXY|nr:unnamed protein product [Bursaphelenchus xylophilus]CAG9110284.1 unnamed protein product [Bursaphelenchus xylophilus]
MIEKELKELSKLNFDDIDDDLIENLSRELAVYFKDGNNKESLESYPEEYVKLFGALIVKSVASGVNPEKFEENLADIDKLSPLVTLYKEQFTHLKGGLETIGWKYPMFVDVDWKVSGVMETDSATGVKEPLVEMEFSSIPTGSTDVEKFKFYCTKRQIQDMQWKVKEAYNLLQKMSQQ